MKVYRQGGRAELRCPAGDHRHVQFVWFPGSEHVDHHAAELRCACGRRLVHDSGDDPWAADSVVVEGEPHKLDG